MSISCSAASQNGNPLQFLSDVAQSSQVNPAFQNTTEKIVVGIPFLSGLGVNWDANFSVNDFSTDDFSFDYEHFYNSLDADGESFALAKAPLVFASLKKNDNTFSFSITERFISTAYFDREVLNFFAQGLQPYYGNDALISPVSVKANYFREVSFGYAHKIWKNLSIGIRPKVLFGKFYYQANSIDLQVSTLEEQEVLQVSPTGNFRIGGPVKLVIDEEREYISVKPDIKPGDYLFNFKNMGAGIDLGISYNINSQTEISLAVLDLGFTSLKHSSYDIVFSESLYYNKNALYQSSDPEAPNYWSPQFAAKAMSDSVAYISTANEISKRHTESLPMQVNIRLKQKMQNNWHLGFSNHYTHFDDHSSNYFTGFAKKSFHNKWDLVGTLSLYNTKKIIPGLGFSRTGNSVQYYLSTNNILELVQPKSAKNINLSFGINFLFTTD